MKEDDGSSQLHRLEAIMIRTCVAIVALLSLSSAALADGTTNSDPVSRHRIARAAARTMSFYPASHYVRNANNCKAQMARAVWSGNNVLLGYACYSNPNGS